MLSGDAGIGKTRLARYFLAWASARGAELLQGSAFESGNHLPFQPLADALRLRVETENSFSDLLNEAWLSPLSKLLPELSKSDPGLSQAEKDAGALNAEESQTQLFELFTQLTMALAQRAPLVIFVDDLQWADSATLDLLHYTVRRWRGSAVQALPALGPCC